MSSRSALEAAPANEVSEVSAAKGEKSTLEQSDALALANAQMQQVNEDEVMNRYGAKHVIRGNQLEIANALKRKDEIIRAMRIRMFMVLATIKVILKSSDDDRQDAKVKQVKKFKVLMRAKRVMYDAANATDNFYAWRMKREQDMKDRVRQKIKKNKGKKNIG